MIRALLVDDEAPARDRLRALLAGHAEIVGEASDGEEAVERIHQLAPDLVFLDIQMPGVSGLEVPPRLSAPRPRIVFCTAYDEFAVAAFEHHALEYLLKPVNSQRLLAIVNRVSREVADQRGRRWETEEAVRTQARLMPHGSIMMAGLECFGTTRPAGDLGGDYFDVLALAGRRTALVVGDISGKGTFAGLLAAALQARVQTLVAHGTIAPAAVIHELNRLSAGTMEPNRFATLVYALYDAHTGTLAYASAGHVPALVVSRAGSVRDLHSTAPAIGWAETLAVEQHVVPVASGDLVLLCSDGIFEAADPAGVELGLDGLTRLARSCVDRPAAEIAVSLLAAVEHFTGGSPPTDDRTLIVAKVL